MTTATGHEKFAVDSANPSRLREPLYPPSDLFTGRRQVGHRRRQDPVVERRKRRCDRTFDEKLKRVECLALSADGLTLAVGGYGNVGDLASIFLLDAAAKTVTPRRRALASPLNAVLLRVDCGWRAARCRAR